MLDTATTGEITGIHVGRTFFGRSFYTVHAYCVDGLLIDTGCPATAAELVAWCRDNGVGRAVNTHHHEDHSGGNHRLQQDLGVPVAAPAGAVPILADFPRLHLYRRVVWRQPANVSVEPLGETVETERYCFEVVPTPGHCDDHVCFFERKQGWLFSGDLYIHQRVRTLRADEDARATLASLRRVLALGPQRLICAHAGVIEDAGSALLGKIDFWEELADRARPLLEAGHSLRWISDRLLGPEGYMTWITRGHFSKINLIRSLVATA